tara:strand:- start:138 stop:407 length:270 start_codon:yes stop_codon:yes gene_type:complete
MAKCIISNDSDTGMARIHYPAYGDLARSPDDTDEALIARIISKRIPEGVEYAIIDDSEIPADRSQRQAWVVIDGALGIDQSRVLDRDEG